MMWLYMPIYGRVVAIVNCFDGFLGTQNLFVSHWKLLQLTPAWMNNIHFACVHLQWSYLQNISPGLSLVGNIQNEGEKTNGFDLQKLTIGPLVMGQFKANHWTIGDEAV